MKCQKYTKLFEFEQSLNQAYDNQTTKNMRRNTLFLAEEAPLRSPKFPIPECLF